MTTYDLAPVPHISGGPGCRDRVGRLAAGLIGRGAHVVLVADPGLAATGLTEEAWASLSDAGLVVSLFSQFGGDPTILAADAAATLARETEAKAVVSLGGGSALDLGKAVAAIATEPHSALHYELGKNPLPARRLASLVIPTTSGTGSELTRTAILTRDDKAKVWLWGETMKPHEVILDPETTLSLPAGLTASTGIDALVHALEAATNANANAANNLYAHEAIRLAAGSLERAVADGKDLLARASLQRAAALAGVAIDNGGTAVAHTIGHALASLRPIHHGRSVALGSLATLAWNIEGDDGRFGAAAKAMGVSSAAELSKRFDALVRSIGIKVSLADEFAGVDPERLAEQMAGPENAAMRDSNLRKIADEDLLVFARSVLTQG
jgi:alcohol dehydrogenase